MKIIKEHLGFEEDMDPYIGLKIGKHSVKDGDRYKLILDLYWNNGGWDKSMNWIKGHWTDNNVRENAAKISKGEEFTIVVKSETIQMKFDSRYRSQFFTKDNFHNKTRLFWKKI